MIGLNLRGIKGLKTGGQDHGSHIEDKLFLLFLKIDGLGGTEFFTGPTPASLEVDTTVPINDIFQRHSLWVFDVNGFSLNQSLIKEVINLLRAFFSTDPAGDTLVHIHIPGVLDDFDFKIPCPSLYCGYLGQGQKLNVQMPADLDQFG
jgi:hypothetical protein